MAGRWVRTIRDRWVILAWQEKRQTTPVAEARQGSDQAESLMRATAAEIQAGLKGLGTEIIRSHEGRWRAAWEIHCARYQARNRIDDREIATVRGLAHDLIQRGRLDHDVVAKTAGLTREHLQAIVQDQKPMTVRLAWVLPLMSKLGEMEHERQGEERTYGIRH